MAGEAVSPTNSGYRCRCAAMIVLVALALSLPIPGHSRLIGELENSGHVLLFGAAALVILRDWKAGLRAYLLAGLITVVLGAATELMQWAEGGYADPLDVVRDAVGAAAFLGFTWTLRHRESMLKYYLIRFGSMAVVIIVFLPSILTGAALVLRWQTFPVIVSFGSRLDIRFCSTGDREPDIVPAPWRTAERAVRVTFGPARHPGFAISGPWPDWSGYGELRFPVYSDSREPVRLTLRIHDSLHNDEYQDRFNTLLEIHPGLNPVRIPVSAIQDAPKDRRMNLRRIRSVFLFVGKPAGDFNLYFGTFSLQ